MLVWLVLGLIGGAIGSRKGRTGAGFLFGILLGPIGWIVILLGPDLGPQPIKCQECKGPLEPGATRCRHCGQAQS